MSELSLQDISILIHYESCPCSSTSRSFYRYLTTTLHNPSKTQHDYPIRQLRQSFYDTTRQMSETRVSERYEVLPPQYRLHLD